MYGGRERIGGGFGRGAGRKNAPSFIYEILYGREKFLYGRTDTHAQKMWRGIGVDEHIPTAALDALVAITAIEMRSSCEGSGPERPTFLIFRFLGEENLKKIQAFVEGMHAFPDVRCGADRGAMGLVRVGVTAPLWYEKDRAEFERWWLELPGKIQTVLAIIDLLTGGGENMAS
jgi:hypothetical protein